MQLKMQSQSCVFQTKQQQQKRFSTGFSGANQIVAWSLASEALANGPHLSFPGGFYLQITWKHKEDHFQRWQALWKQLLSILNFPDFAGLKSGAANCQDHKLEERKNIQEDFPFSATLARTGTSTTDSKTALEIQRMLSTTAIPFCFQHSRLCECVCASVLERHNRKHLKGGEGEATPGTTEDTLQSR